MSSASLDPLTEHQRIVDAHFASVAPYWQTVYEADDIDGELYRVRRARALAVAASLDSAPGTRVLEIGCGAGSTTVALARDGHDVVAMDTAPAMIALTLRAAREDGVPERVRVVCGDARRLPFDDGSFGLVVALGVVPWIPAVEAALREVSRVLRPAGHLVVSADNRWRLNYVLDPRWLPFLAPLRARVRRALDRLGGRDPREGRVPWRTHSIREFDRALDASGLRKVGGSTLGFGPFSLGGFRLFPERMGVRIHRSLQRRADSGWPLLRSLGSYYVAVARKPA